MGQTDGVKTASRLIVTLMAAALVLSACGSDKDKSISTPARPDEPSSTTAPPSTTGGSTTVPQTVVVPPPPPPPASTTPVTLPPITVPLTITVPPSTGGSPTTGVPTPTTAGPSPTIPPTPTTKPTKPSRRTVVFTPADAPKRKATVVTPRTDHLDTLLVLVHGGNGSNGTRNQLREWQDFYAANGVPSIAIDYFLWKPSTPPPVFPQPERDVTAAVQWATEHAGELGIDPDRIVVQGFSTGAALGAQALLSDTSAPAGFVGIEGVYDGEQRNPQQYYGGPPGSADPDVRARYEQANSIARAADANGPSFLFAAADGPAALREQAQSFDDALADVGSQLVLVPGPGGDFESGDKALTPSGEAVAQQVLTWLTENFPPGA